MTLVSSLAFPGSKTLAGWWRQLASHQPRAFGVGYLFLHRVEAAVLAEKPRQFDPLVLLLLQALDRECSSADATDAGRRDLLSRLEARLCLNRQVLFQMLRSLEIEELAHGRSGAWNLTDKGKRALAHGEYPVKAVDRRAFHFLERWDVSGERAPPPHFVSLRGDAGQAWTAEDCPFDVALVQDCVQRSTEWKTRFGFPLEIQRALGPSSPVTEEGTAEPDAWQRVIVDRPERYLAVWVLVPGPSEQSCLLAFAARQDGWALNSSEPLMRIADGWQDVLPSLCAAPAAESLRRAWTAWAHSRGLTDADADAAGLSLLGHCLEVQTPPSALERLKKAKSDVFKGDTWLLIGDGLIRTAVVLRLR